MIDAWEKICSEHEDWSLKIAGPINSSYSSQLHKNTLARNIPRLSFLGEVTGQDKDELLNKGSVLVLPTYTENFGVVVAEALAHALPVITTTATPWPNLQKDRMGWVIQTNLNELIKSMRAAMNTQKHVLSEMGENGRSWVSEKYSWDSVGQSMNSTYRWLAGSGDKPQCIVDD